MGRAGGRLGGGDPRDGDARNGYVLEVSALLRGPRFGLSVDELHQLLVSVELHVGLPSLSDFSQVVPL